MKTRIRELVNQLNVYRNAYYNKNKSLVEDKVYDELLDKLEELEMQSGIVYADSPTITVGYNVVSDLKKVKNHHRLESLDKTTDIRRLIDYFGSRKSVIMAKMDGLTISAYYKDGKFVSASTRGDSETGEDITHNYLVMKNVPLEIAFKGELHVDGEAIITYEDFNKINESIPNGSKYKNPRNLASGSVRQHDSGIASKRNLKFFAWKLYDMIVDGEDICPNSHSERLEILSKFGFDVCPYVVCNNPKTQFEMSIEFIKSKSAELGLPIDGAVATFDDVEYGESLGHTSKFPRHSLAFKFYQERVSTILRDIEWTTSRTGLINPVAVFDSVEIDGTIVSRATVNNVSVIEELELGIGDEIEVIKANQIIPQIVENKTRSGRYKLPLGCPCCGFAARISVATDRKVLRCINDFCPAKMQDAIVNFCSRAGMNISGLSEKRIEIFVNNGYIKNFCDIFTLHQHKDEIVNLEGFGEESVNNILEAINKSRKCKLSNLITALGIPGIGKSSANALAEYVSDVNYSITFSDDYSKFIDMAYKYHDWTNIQDFGEIMSQNINAFVHDRYILLTVLQEYLDVENDFSFGKLSNKTFCITGSLRTYKNRDELMAVIIENKGKVSNTVTSKTDYLITNDESSNSSKCKKANKLGVKIITELEFKDMIDG